MNTNAEELAESIERKQTTGKEGSAVRMASVLIVDDEPGIRSFLQKGLRKYFGLVETAEDVATAEELRRHCHFDLIITDIRLPGQTGGVEWVKELRAQGGATGVIFMTAHADMETAIAALRAGAEDFILKPFRMEQMIAAVERYLVRQKMQRENFVLKRQVEQIYDSAGMVGKCQQMQSLCGVIKRVAPMPSTVLVEGESGTGKELAARAIHEMSGRSGSFVPVNCGAMTAELLESELFGHVKGAFTGAHLSRDGLFTYASGGTLFLDEIGEMPLSMQAHLLRALEERTIRPVGSNREVPVDVRIIAASNRDLEQEVRQGKFREDLYYRLNVLSLRIPALRERKEDIPLLVEHFVEILSAELGIAPPHLGESELVRLLDYDWPGNVRELKNVIERCLLLNKSPSLCLLGSEAVGSQATAFDPSKTMLLEAIEKQHILKVLDLEGGNKSAAARVLGISRKTLERKTQAWGVN
ncbi:sigma-54-dependent transcriptional regulator [Candidatus Thiodiazotropha sp. CDECU1]|uniref:sigma-54-dependent transcriptional regulator n=1 Tax=Candidatus Thiodiazotropha sp. CDECU1 TaxID=3065865 RepID=UPI00292EE712|nr:sigma-54 dependent transcriptional regulator [Candidatus Thiodiazotropha sp. CDECU1]